MRNDIFKWYFTGRLGKDPEMKGYTSKKDGSERFVCNLVVAVNRYNKQTDWINVAIYDKQTSEYVSQYLKKGDKIFVCGDVRSNVRQIRDTEITVIDRSCVAQEVYKLFSARRDEEGANNHSKYSSSNTSSEFNDVSKESNHDIKDDLDDLLI